MQQYYAPFMSIQPLSNIVMIHDGWNICVCTGVSGGGARINSCMTEHPAVKYGITIFLESDAVMFGDNVPFCDF